MAKKASDMTLFERRPDLEKRYYELRQHLKEIGILGKIKLY